MNERQIYESPEDRANQLAIAHIVSELWPVVLTEHEPLSHQDFTFSYKGEAVFIAEIKCRTNLRARYPTYKLSRHKIEHGLDRQWEKRITFVLIVRWKDGIFWRWCTDKDLSPERTRWGGREDRNDPQDVGPETHIPIGEFRPLTKIGRR